MDATILNKGRRLCKHLLVFWWDFSAIIATKALRLSLMADLCGGGVIIRCKMSDFMVNYPAWIIIDECALVARFWILMNLVI